MLRPSNTLSYEHAYVRLRMDAQAALERILRMVHPNNPECEDAWSGDAVSIRAVCRQELEWLDSNRTRPGDLP